MFVQPKLTQKLLQNCSLVGFICLSALGIIGLQQPQLKQLTETGLSNIDYHQQEELEKVKLDLIELLPTFGYDNLVANWTMLRFIQYFGDSEARKETGYSLSPKYLEAIVKRDPRFVRAYLSISPASSINAGQAYKTVQLMEKGLENLEPSITDAHFVYLYKGVDELLFLGNQEASKKSHAMAAKWAKIAGDERIEKAASSTVKFLEENPDSKIAQVGAWFMVFINAGDDKTRELARFNIQKLGGKLESYPDGRVTAIPPKEN